MPKFMERNDCWVWKKSCSVACFFRDFLRLLAAIPPATPHLHSPQSRWRRAARRRIDPRLWTLVSRLPFISARYKLLATSHSPKSRRSRAARRWKALLFLHFSFQASQISAFASPSTRHLLRTAVSVFPPSHFYFYLLTSVQF